VVVAAGGDVELEIEIDYFTTVKQSQMKGRKWTMQNEKCKMQNEVRHSAFFILH
jgi:hypothetical protein